MIQPKSGFEQKLIENPFISRPNRGKTRARSDLIDGTQYANK